MTAWDCTAIPSSHCYFSFENVIQNNTLQKNENVIKFHLKILENVIYVINIVS